MQDVLVKDILTPNLVSVSPDTSMVDAVKIMRYRRISCIAVLEDGKPLGIVTERNIVDFTAQYGFAFGNQGIAGFMISPVLTVNSSVGLLEAYNTMTLNQVRHLIVTNGEGKAEGVVTQSDLVDQLGYDYFVEIRKVAQVMSKVLATAPPTAVVQDVLMDMARKRVSCIVVSEGSKPLGVLTERDVPRILLDRFDIATTPVTEVMSSPVTTLLWNTPIQEASAIMKTRKIRRLIAVNGDGDMVGLITQSDLIKGLEGKYIEALRQDLAEKTVQIKTLSGLLPICTSCKKIRDDSGYWRQIEHYIREHCDADFSHGICPECMARLYGDYPRKVTNPETERRLEAPGHRGDKA